jgi:hypothetical protein
VIWSTHSYTVLTSTTTSQPIHDVRWDPYTVNEFASVGAGGTLLFWLLDETRSEVGLSVHEAQLPDNLLATHHVVRTLKYYIIPTNVCVFILSFSCLIVL